MRAFTDDELDRAAPFSLSLGAAVTAQFVIEDTRCGTAGTIWRVFAPPLAADSPGIAPGVQFSVSLSMI